jgi:hypothetical protein
MEQTLTIRHWRLQLFIARNLMARVNPDSLISSHCSAAVAPVRYFVFRLHHGTLGRYLNGFCLKFSSYQVSDFKFDEI